MFLTTAERRTDAHAFYRRLRFEETGRRFAKIALKFGEEMISAHEAQEITQRIGRHLA